MNNNKKILITEFINQNSFEHLNKKFDVRYDEKLFENENEISRIITVSYTHLTLPTIYSV